MLPDASALPTLDSERLRLRWLTATDAPALFGIFSDAEVMRYWERPPMTELVEAVALVEHIHECFARGDLFQWGIERRSDRLIIGTCTLASITTTHRRAEIGFALGRPHWRQGYATEAVSRALRFAFETLDLHRVEADVDPRNAASLHTLERLGFSREGLLRERYHVAGETQDSVMLGLLRREWEGMR